MYGFTFWQEVSKALIKRYPNLVLLGRIVISNAAVYGDKVQAESRGSGLCVWVIYVGLGPVG